MTGEHRCRQRIWTMSAVHNVIGVRRERSADGSHRHVTGVWVQENDDGPPYTLRQVAESIREGETWRARVDGVEARVQPAARCPHLGCKMQPYLTIRDGDGRNLLERVRAW
jgi:hypothetical protein